MTNREWKFISIFLLVFIAMVSIYALIVTAELAKMNAYFLDEDEPEPVLTPTATEEQEKQYETFSDNEIRIFHFKSKQGLYDVEITMTPEYITIWDDYSENFVTIFYRNMYMCG